jgi:hypothetical protein
VRHLPRQRAGHHSTALQAHVSDCRRAWLQAACAGLGLLLAGCGWLSGWELFNGLATCLVASLRCAAACYPGWLPTSPLALRRPGCHRI